jgi:hypothetical protein
VNMSKFSPPPVSIRHKTARAPHVVARSRSMRRCSQLLSIPLRFPFSRHFTASASSPLPASSTPGFTRVRGTRDLFDADVTARDAVIHAAARVVASYNCVPIETPILEQAALFERSLGDGSDVVQKEMFQLTSLGGERLAMRPEGTASVVRALCQKEGQPRGRVWYHGPMFRYERPQSGRYRQVKRACASTQLCGTDILF